MPSLPIARITQPVVICSPDTEASALVSQCLQADTSLGVVLDAQQHPVGIVRLPRLLRQSLAPVPLSGPIADVATEVLPICLPVSALMEPVGLLSASLSWVDLCQQLASRESGHWAIVNGDGQFLGLLNSERALSWLAGQQDQALSARLPPLATWAPWPQTEPVTPWPLLRSPHSPTMSVSQAASVLQERAGSALGESSRLGTPTLSPPGVADRARLPLGWQWLDGLPLPLCLQTDTGHVLGQNRAWSQVIGDRGDRPLDGFASPPEEWGPSTSSSWPSCPLLTVLATPSMEFQTDAGSILVTHAGKTWQLVYLPLSSMPPPMDIACPSEKGGGMGGVPTWGSGEHGLRLRLLAAIEVTPIYIQNQSLLAENRDLSQRHQAKDDFLMSLSHDIKSPLTAILGLASLLQTTTVGPLNARQHQYIQLIHHNARLLTTLANQSFELACLDAGQLTLNRKPVDLRSVCERAIAQAQALQTAPSPNPEPLSPGQAASAEAALAVDRRFIQQAWEIDVNTERLVADELRLCQMLTHLLSNALKFSSPTGQVGLRISRWHPDWLAFTVWDTGMGIPAPEQPRLFQKLQRLQFAHSRYPGGVGMGLALTYRLVRLHGGIISFLSEAEGGSEFTLLLPASNPDWSAPQPPRLEPGVAIAATATIVLVATTPSQGQGLIEGLQALGYRVVVARFPQDLLEKAQCLKPSVIFLDESWLVDTDASPLALLKADPDTAQLPVIATVPRSVSASHLQSQVDGILSLPAPISLLQSWFEYLTSLRQGVETGKPPSILSPEPVPAPSSLTLLSLSQLLPDLPLGGVVPSPSSGQLPMNLPEVFYQYQYRLLEADDLEQAALLATIWHPDLLLVRGDTLVDPAHYFAQIQAYPALASRAIVALNCSDTAPWRQTVTLRIFPYDLYQTVDVAHFLASLHQIAANHPPLTRALPLSLEEG